MGGCGGRIVGMCIRSQRACCLKCPPNQRLCYPSHTISPYPSAHTAGTRLPTGLPFTCCCYVFSFALLPTPHPQVQKIRLLLRQRGLGSIRVGTVDDYQGQEERIIFISTTLSKPESLPSVATAPQPPSVPMSGAAFAASDAHESGGQEAGADRNLGFWRNPKRFNVSREP